MATSPASPGEREVLATRWQLIAVGLLGQGGTGRVLLCRALHDGDDLDAPDDAATQAAAAAASASAGAGGFVAVKAARRTGPMGADGMMTVASNAVMQEVAALERLKHPNIVKYLGTVASQRSMQVFLKLEYVPGGDLATRLQRTATEGAVVPEQSIWRWLSEIVSGLAYMHRHKIVHRDIKPRNLLLTAEDGVKICDLGSARKLEREHELIENPVGTSYYLAPELCQQKWYDDRCDVWSLGCTLHECCTLRRTFPGATFQDVVRRVLIGKRAPIEATHYSSELRQTIDRLLTHSFAKRPRAIELHAEERLKDLAEDCSYAARDPEPTAPEPAAPKKRRVSIATPPTSIPSRHDDAQDMDKDGDSSDGEEGAPGDNAGRVTLGAAGRQGSGVRHGENSDDEDTTERPALLPWTAASMVLSPAHSAAQSATQSKTNSASTSPKQSRRAVNTGGLRGSFLLADAPADPASGEPSALGGARNPTSENINVVSLAASLRTHSAAATLGGQSASHSRGGMGLAAAAAGAGSEDTSDGAGVAPTSSGPALMRARRSSAGQKPRPSPGPSPTASPPPPYTSPTMTVTTGLGGGRTGAQSTVGMLSTGGHSIAGRASAIPKRRAVSLEVQEKQAAQLRELRNAYGQPTRA